MLRVMTVANLQGVQGRHRGTRQAELVQGMQALGCDT